MNILTAQDRDLIQKVSIDDKGSYIDFSEVVLSELIDNWTYLVQAPPYTFNVGEYCRKLRDRDYLEMIINHVTIPTRTAIEEIIEPLDRLFKIKMVKLDEIKDTRVHFPNAFWYTHTIHHVKGYGIEKEDAHPNALVFFENHGFFWNNYNELCPFGSDEGDMALQEFRRWRLGEPDSDLKSCIEWVLTIGDISLEKYEKLTFDEKSIQKQIENPDFDDDYEIWTLDITVIGTGFGQLADEGKIDQAALKAIQVALKRQIIYHKIMYGVESVGYYQYMLEVLNLLASQSET